MRGRDLITGLPKEIIVSDTHVREALLPSIRVIVNNVKSVVEQAPPEIISDMMQRGIVLAGGGALLRGLDQLIAEETQIPVTIADDPLTCVARGAGMIVEDLEALKDVLLTPNFDRLPR